MTTMRRVRTGFTLIEMIVVLVVLAAVAALVVPRLGFVEEQAGNATAASATAQAASNLEVYKTSVRSYPLGMDSLIDSTGALYGDLWVHPNPAFGPGVYLEARALSGLPSGVRTSLGHAFRTDVNGERYVYDHDPAPASNPNNSATTRRLLNLSASTTDTLAFVRRTATPPLSTFLASFHRTLGYPNGIPANVELIAMGLGPNMNSLGDTQVSAGLHTEQDLTKYGRYIAIFAAYTDGKAAQLRAVVDSQATGIEGNISSYRRAAPQHD
jgi:prepilin-type N-terminal cleavage/methylation domain-containing protein